jgi:hypothetical protein
LLFITDKTIILLWQYEEKVLKSWLNSSARHTKDLKNQYPHLQYPKKE